MRLSCLSSTEIDRDEYLPVVVLFLPVAFILTFLLERVSEPLWRFELLEPEGSIDHGWQSLTEELLVSLTAEKLLHSIKNILRHWFTQLGLDTDTAKELTLTRPSSLCTQHVYIS